MRNVPRSFRRPGGFRRAVALALLASPLPAAAQAILAYDVVEPRTFGYVIGDEIRREVRLDVRPGYRLDEASLPKAGRLDRWLELAAPELRAESVGNGRRYRLVLTYQVMNAPRALAAVTIPQADLRLVSETRVVTTLLPALEITVSPLTSDLRPEELSASALQPDRPPAPLPLAARQARLAWTGATLLVLLLLAAWRRGFRAAALRRTLPFTRALRQLKRLPAVGTPADEAAGLRIVHQAINRTAGRAVFAHTLGELLAAHPEFASLQGDFERLFAASGRAFFAAPGFGGESGSDLAALRDLCRRCSRIERRTFGERARTRPILRDGGGRSVATEPTG